MRRRNGWELLVRIIPWHKNENVDVSVGVHSEVDRANSKIKCAIHDALVVEAHTLLIIFNRGEECK